MTAALAPFVAADREPLRAAVGRRSPAVAAALDPDRATARARRWVSGAWPDAVVDGVRVGSVLYRPDGGCTLRYVVRLGPGHRERVLLVTVPPSGRTVRLSPFPADPGLPTLRLAVDPALMRQVLGRVVPGTGGERAVGRCAVDVVHHPRQGRCVLRYRLSPGAGGAGELRHPVVYGKVHADAAAAASSASAARVLRRGIGDLPADLRIDVPRPLAVVPPLRLGLTEAVAGRPSLPGLLRAAGERGNGHPTAVSAALLEASRAAGRAAAAVHLVPADAGLPVRDLDGERTAVDRELTRLAQVWPDVADELRRRTAAALAPTGSGHGGRAGARVVAHGDFTPGQLLLDDDGAAGVVDLDDLCLAEPAVDLGRFLAYLHVAGRRRAPDAGPLLADLTAEFLESYRAACPSSDARLDRVAAWRAASLARLGASACWQLKDTRLSAVLDVLECGDDCLGEVAR